MRLFLLLFTLLVLASLIFADFKIKEVNVKIYNIEQDGKARVRESIKFYVIGDYEQALYKNGFDRNDLSFWATTTALRDVKLHVNTNKVDILDFRVTPQALKKCDPFLNLCHGEIIIEYIAAPYYNKSNGEPLRGSGIFSISKYKPRTVRYSLNPSALSFTSTEYGDMLLEKHVTLTLLLPAGSTVYEINPRPEGYENNARELSWSDTILVRFALVFDVEGSIGQEIAEFFSNLFTTVQRALSWPEGLAIIAIVAILLGTYIYLKFIKK